MSEDLQAAETCRRQPPILTSGHGQRIIRPDDPTKLQRALASLPAKERRLLALLYNGGLTLEEAAVELGIKRSWACRLHARALGALRAELGVMPEIADAP